MSRGPTDVGCCNLNSCLEQDALLVFDVGSSQANGEIRKQMNKLSVPNASVNSLLLLPSSQEDLERRASYGGHDMQLDFISSFVALSLSLSLSLALCFSPSFFLSFAARGNKRRKKAFSLSGIAGSKESLVFCCPPMQARERRWICTSQDSSSTWLGIPLCDPDTLLCHSWVTFWVLEPNKEYKRKCSWSIL